MDQESLLEHGFPQASIRQSMSDFIVDPTGPDHDTGLTESIDELRAVAQRVTPDLEPIDRADRFCSVFYHANALLELMVHIPYDPSVLPKIQLVVSDVFGTDLDMGNLEARVLFARSLSGDSSVEGILLWSAFRAYRNHVKYRTAFDEAVGAGEELDSSFRINEELDISPFMDDVDSRGLQQGEYNRVLVGAIGDSDSHAMQMVPLLDARWRFAAAVSLQKESGTTQTDIDALDEEHESWHEPGYLEIAHIMFDEQQSDLSAEVRRSWFDALESVSKVTEDY